MHTHTGPGPLSCGRLTDVIHTKRGSRGAQELRRERESCQYLRFYTRIVRPDT